MSDERGSWRDRLRHLVGGIVADIIGAGTVAVVLAGYPIMLSTLHPGYIALIVCGAVAMGLLVSAKGRRASRVLWRALAGRRPRRQMSLPAPATAFEGLRLLRRFTVDATGLTVRVRDRDPLRTDPFMRARFRELSAAREARGLVPYYDAVRFLPVGLPRWSQADGRILIEAARIDYAVAALVIDPDAGEDAREAALERLSRVDDVAACLAEHWRQGKLGLLGVQACLVTADNKLLMRRRGDSVLFASGRWDVSVSGFAGSIDLQDGRNLDVTRTVENETYREIGQLRADPRSIRILGATHNQRTGAYDILACWKLDADLNELLDLLSKRRARAGEVFDTDIKAIERYVWDSRNLVVELNQSDILSAWHDCGISAADFEPQSLLCIQLTLALLAGPEDGPRRADAIWPGPIGSE